MQVGGVAPTLDDNFDLYTELFVRQAGNYVDSDLDKFSISSSISLNLSFKSPP